jgi:hypothetical protein
LKRQAKSSFIFVLEKGRTHLRRAHLPAGAILSAVWHFAVALVGLNRPGYAGQAGGGLVQKVGPLRKYLGPQIPLLLLFKGLTGGTVHMPCVLYGHFDKVACCEPNNNVVALLWDLEIAAKPC